MPNYGLKKKKRLPKAVRMRGVRLSLERALAREEAASVATSSSAMSHASGTIVQNDGSPNEAMVDLDSFDNTLLPLYTLQKDRQVW